MDMDVQRRGARFLRPAPPAVRLARSTLSWLLGAGIAVLALLLVFGTNGLSEYMQLRRQRESLLQEQAALESQAADLEGQLEALRAVPFALEKLARERYNMRRPGEEIILLVPDPKGF